MTDRGTVRIGSEGGDHVSITPVRRDSGGWPGADIEVRCDGWTGSALWRFHTGELAQFAREIRTLYRRLEGTAALHPLEPNVELDLIGDGKGRITVEGEARNDFASGTRLVFRFDIDQTYLIGIAEALERLDEEPRQR